MFCGRKCYTEHRQSNDFQAAKFWQKVDKSGSCWIYVGAVESNGYGYPSWRKGHKLAHRLAYELAKGPIPKGMLVCHTCDTPPCCNPEHLFLGTKQSNKDDSTAKRRHTYGERNWKAKLTEEQAVELYAMRGGPLNQREAGERFGVSKAIVQALWAGRTWRHVTQTLCR